MTASSQSTCLIEARGVVKSFGQTPALRGANVQVDAGEMLAVMGPSGSGKSTLLHCLAGIFTPDEGEISFDGQRLDQMDETRRTELRRTSFGFVFQFGQLVPELTAADNIALPPPTSPALYIWPGPPQDGVPAGGAVAGPARPSRQGRPAQRRAVRR
jgi:ABC-type transporter Mla maintaining outer membrane lipid asymmetry ATPase subunit MlaF